MNRNKCSNKSNPNNETYLCRTLPKPQMKLKSKLPKEPKNKLYVPNKRENAIIAKIMFIN